MSESSDDADERLAPLMEYFGDRVNRAFAYFLCVLEFEDDEDLHADPTNNARAWSLQTIKNACMHTTLIALRDLDDFLSTRKKQRQDDTTTAAAAPSRNSRVRRWNGFS